MGVVEQVPRYTISHTDDGTQERLQLTVSLPGLTSAKDFEVRIEHDRFILRAEGRYNLTLPLHPPVEETAEVLQFVKRKALLKAELKVLSASDQAARGASPVSPSRPDASPSLASTSNLTGGDIKPSNSAQPKSRGAQAAANSTERFKGQHGGVQAPDPDSDVDSRPELHSNDCDSSPEASHVRANGAASSASGHSTSTSHAPANGQPFSCPPDSGSDESDSSPHGRHWSNDASPTSAAGSSSHAAMRGNALSGGSPASQELDQDAEASFAKSAHEDHSSQHPFHSLQQPQTKQSLDLAAVYFQQAFALLYRHDWERAAQLLFEAQLVDSTTSNVLSLAIGGLPAGQAADVRRNIGAVLIREVEARMQPDGSGAAHTVQGAWQQAHAVLLLQAIGHPAAELFGLPPCPPIVEAEARGSHHPGVASKSSRQQQRTAQGQPSQASGSGQPPADTARNSNRKRSASAWPTSATGSHDDQDTSGSETFEQEQQQQQQFFQELPGKKVHPPAPASYGPAEQAEAKRQANKEAALTWLDKAKAAAVKQDWTAAVQKAQRGVSLDQDADWASEAHSLIQSWQAAQTQHAGASGSNNPAGKQAGSSKSNPQGRQGQQQTKKQAKKRTRQSQHQQSKQQQQEQPRQQQPKQEQEQPSTSRPQEQTGAASGSENAFKHAPGSAAHGKYSHTHGPQGQPTESAEPWMKDSSAAHHEWLSNVFLPMVKHAASCVGRGCRWLLRGLMRAVLYAAAAVLLCILLVPQITAGILYVTGRREWCYQLAAAKKAGKAWAKLVYYVLSPLLALAAVCTLYCLLHKGTFADSAAMTAGWAAWPVVKLWSKLTSTGGLFHPNRAWIHIILVIARITTEPRWVKLLSSGLLLWWSLNGGWTALVTTLLATTVSACFCLDTVGTPVAAKFAHVALNNTYITGFFYRAVILAVTRESLDSSEQADPPPEPAAGAPPPAWSAPPRPSNTDAKTEVSRILSAKTHYAVLEVEHTADEETIKRAKKMKSLLVHPDKAGELSGAGDAFGKVIDAAEVLCDPSKKRQYDAEQAASAYKPSQPAAPQHRPHEKDDPNVSWQSCSLCGELHKMVRTDKAQKNARWCKECNCYHSVQKGEGWVTREGLWAFMGRGEYVVYACLFPDGQIYDVSELSICQGMLDSAAFRQLGSDCCKVWLHFGNPEAANRRQRYQPPNESTGARKKGKKARRRR